MIICAIFQLHWNAQSSLLRQKNVLFMKITSYAFASYHQYGLVVQLVLLHLPLIIKYHSNSLT